MAQDLHSRLASVSVLPKEVPANVNNASAVTAVAIAAAAAAAAPTPTPSTPVTTASGAASSKPLSENQVLFLYDQIDRWLEAKNDEKIAKFINPKKAGVVPKGRKKVMEKLNEDRVRQHEAELRDPKTAALLRYASLAPDSFVSRSGIPAFLDSTVSHAEISKLDVCCLDLFLCKPRCLMIEWLKLRP
jgi:hypothetical protein